MKLSHARAAAILASTMNNKEISEYSPKEVKKSVTGRGAASKEQVSFMVRKILNIPETPEFFDATDALAVAVCHGLKFGQPKQKVSGWSDYVKNNPDKVL
jgi:crossover junction endodeoxyribonuclease RuvC